MNGTPTWLTVSENGAKGEARTKALLLDRFWVLERSVDVEGADFIVQSPSGNHTLDRNPPRFGLIQAKFFQDGDTVAYIHHEYVCNEKKEARPEFFVLIHSREDDDQEVYFLTSSQIVKSFERVPDGQRYAGRYKIKGQTVFNNVTFKRKKKDILDIIQKALIDAAAKANYAFMSQFLPGVVLHWMHESDILTITNENVVANFRDDNSGVINQVNGWKEIAKKNYERLKSMKYSLEDILGTNDPIAALCGVSEFVFDQYELHPFSNTQSAACGAVGKEDFCEYFDIFFNNFIKNERLDKVWSKTLLDLKLEIESWQRTKVVCPPTAYWHIKIEVNLDFTLGPVSFEASEKEGYSWDSGQIYSKFFSDKSASQSSFADEVVENLSRVIAKRTATMGKGYSLP
jgi:hypothetical protein